MSWIMNCAEFEQLMDACLDGELSGSLRLEFDAHRLRCRRCQLTMVMMESVGNVVASDRHVPAVSDDFTDRVMATIGRQRPLSVRLRPTRVAVVAGALLQAAAVLYLAIWLPFQHSPAPQDDAGTDARVVLSSAESRGGADLDPFWDEADSVIKFADREALYDYIASRVEAAGTVLVSDLSQMATYVSALSVPDDVAHASGRMDGASPLRLIMEAFVPPTSEEAEPPPSATNQHAL